MKNIAFILAGGTGSRVGGDKPKQLLPLSDGRSILEHAVDAFEYATFITEIAIVMHPDWMEEAKEIVKRNTWRKVKKIIPGGKERWESSWNAISAYLPEDKKDPDTFFWFHDAARPFVSQDIIRRVGDALKSHLAVTVAIPVTDTLYSVQNGNVANIRVARESGNAIAVIPCAEAMMQTEDGRVSTGSYPRDNLKRTQTPQAFHYAVIGPAYMRAIQKGQIQTTDDVGILMEYNPDVEVHIITGDESNKKITYITDL